MITITANHVLIFCSIVTGVFGVWKIIKELRKPKEDLKAKVEEHEQYLKNNHSRLKEVEASNKMILQCLLIIINHDISGNGIDKLKETRDDLNDYLINK